MTQPTPTPPAPSPPAPTPPTPPAPTPEPERMLPQSQVNQIVAREVAQTKQKAAEELAADLGVSLEEAKALVKATRDRQDAEKSEAQRAREAADQEKAAAQKDRAEASQAKHETWSDAALIRAGAPSEEEDLVRLRGLLTVQVGATREEIEQDVEKVKERFGALFGTSPTPPKPRIPHSDPPGHPVPTPPKEGMERGRERARADLASRTERPKPPGI